MLVHAMAAEKQLGQDDIYAHLFEASAEAVVVVDADRTVLVANAVARSMLGADAHSVHRSRLDDYFCAPAPKADPHLVHQTATLRNVAAGASDVEIRTQPLAGGSGLLVMTIREARSSPLRDDSTDSFAVAAAEQASRAKSDFICRMSHELRTPLNSILVLTQTLLRDPAMRADSMQEQLSRLRHIRSGGRHLLTLINDILDLSRIEAGEISVQTRPLSCVSLIDEVVEIIQPLSDSSRVGLVFHRPSAALPAVLADGTRLRQVLFNLLSNAVKYNRRDGFVDVRIEHTERSLTVEVSDSGIGMTEEQLAQLYQPFNRLGRDHTEVEGAGIGLSVTRQLVELMDGSIAITSTAGKGTTARVTLPAASVAAPVTAGPLHSLSMPLEFDPVVQPEGVILCVEDNPVNQVVLEASLARWKGVKIIHATDGRSALENLRMCVPDLMLLDMGLPDMKGLDLLKAVRANPQTRHMNLVCLSGSSMPEEIEAAMRAGATDYLTKPFDLSNFLRKVSGWLKRDQVKFG